MQTHILGENVMQTAKAEHYTQTIEVSENESSPCKCASECLKQQLKKQINERQVKQQQNQKQQISQQFKQSGFTLLELLIVIGILAAITSMALFTSADTLNQQRFEDTQRKIKTIRHAILGYPERTVNGAPEISGFVADMGRLPKTLRELLTGEDYCNGDLSLTTKVACDAAVVTPPTPQPEWIDMPAYEYDSDSGLWAGWRGPYIDVISDLDGTRRYRDGWGNRALDDDEDDINFGWEYDVSTGALILQSRGLDNAENPSVQVDYDLLNDFEKDYPSTLAAGGDYSVDPNPIIASSEYRLLITNIAGVGGIAVDFGAPTVVRTDSLCLRLYRSENGNISVGGLSSSDAGESITWDGSSIQKTFKFDNASPAVDVYLNQGVNSFVVFLKQPGENCSAALDGSLFTALYAATAATQPAAFNYAGGSSLLLQWKGVN